MTVAFGVDQFGERGCRYSANMHSISMNPVGVVRNSVRTPQDDVWGGLVSTITLDRDRFTPESLAGLEGFSHVEVLYLFHLVPEAEIQMAARHPRGRTDWPLVGIFAQRGKDRPNRIGSTVCRLLQVRAEELCLDVESLDAIDGTPVLDIKPYMSEFAPREPVRQPAWASELMAGYWRQPNAS